MNKYTGKIWDVVKSKRFVSSFVILILTGASAFVPELEEHFAEISAISTASILALVSGYSIQDVVIAIMTGQQIPQPAEPVLLEQPGVSEDEILQPTG